VTSPRWEELQRVFDEAVERTAELRPAFVAQACGDDLELRRNVEALLRAHEAAGRFLETPVGDETPTEGTDLVGRRVGPYTIAAEIGRGGMGTVYRARRDDDVYFKEVALKLLSGGARSALFVERFRRERRILARLEHPSIARLIDGGTTEDGYPYFAMEYVEGLPLDLHCARGGLDLRSRLDLFRAVCGAVAYAHRNLVVHRDLKPTNILVTSDGTPKLLDFGIAKLLAPDEPGAPELTRTGMALMTPEYASPEQVAGGPVTTATDVYALGVLLYQLLAERRPYELGTRSPEEIARVVCHEEPPAPSAAVGAGADADRLRHALAGDLDTIVLKALRKEPERRYRSVDELSEDVRRHLDGRPVLARKDTLFYRTGKFVRRHRGAVAAAALVVLSLVGGLAATLRQARIAEWNRAQATHRSRDAQRLAHSLVFELHDSIADLPGATRARELLLRRASEMLDTLGADAPGDPALEEDLAAAYHRLGEVLHSNNASGALGNKDAALLAHRKGLGIRERLAAAAPGDLARQDRLAASHIDLSHATEGQEALAHAREAVAIASRLAALDPPGLRSRELLARALYARGSAEISGGDVRAATATFEKIVADFAGLPSGLPTAGAAARVVVLSHKRLGAILAKQGRSAEALVHYRKVVAWDEARIARDPQSVEARRDLSVSILDLGWALGKAGDHRTEVERYQAALVLRDELARADPENARARLDLTSALVKLCFGLRDVGRPGDALTHCERARATLGPDEGSPGLLAQIHFAESRSYADLHRWEEAVRAARAAERIERGQLAREPTNRWLKVGVAQDLMGIGDALVGLSSEPGGAAARPAASLREAAAAYREALSLAGDVQAAGGLVGDDARIPDQARAGLDRCERALRASGRGERDQRGAGRERSDSSREGATPSPPSTRPSRARAFGPRRRSAGETEWTEASGSSGPPPRATAVPLRRTTKSLAPRTRRKASLTSPGRATSKPRRARTADA
jgi:non-specific serine/threonine protein kinase/serine/threonine-protein kinase